MSSCLQQLTVQSFLWPQYARQLCSGLRQGNNSCKINTSRNPHDQPVLYEQDLENKSLKSRLFIHGHRNNSLLNESFSEISIDSRSQVTTLADMIDNDVQTVLTVSQGHTYV